MDSDDLSVQAEFDVNAEPSDAANESGLMDTPPEPAYDALTRLAASLLQVPAAFVSLVNKEKQFFKSECGLPELLARERSLALSLSFCKHVVTSGRPIVIKDARRDTLLKESRAITELGIIAYAGFPVVDRFGRAIGAFAAMDTQPRLWSPEQLEILGAMAAQTSAHIAARGLSESGAIVVVADLERSVHALQLNIQSFWHYGPLNANQREALTTIEAGFQASWSIMDKMSVQAELPVPLGAEPAPAVAVSG